MVGPLKCREAQGKLSPLSPRLDGSGHKNLQNTATPLTTALHYISDKLRYRVSHKTDTNSIIALFPLDYNLASKSF